MKQTIVCLSVISGLITSPSFAAASPSSKILESPALSSYSWLGRVSASLAFPITTNQFQTLILLDGVNGDSTYQRQRNTKLNGSIGVSLGTELPLISKVLISTWQPTLSYYQGLFNINGILSQRLGAVIQGYDYEYVVDASQVMFDNKVLITGTNKYHPYGSVGLGASFNLARAYRAHPLDQTFARSPVFSNNRTSAFSYSLGLGLDIDYSSNLAFGLGYRYVDYGLVSLNTSPVQNTSAKLKLNNLTTNQLIAELTVRL